MRGLTFVSLFWLLMNVLLWHSEYGKSNGLESPLPVSVVWEKMLQTPDSSSLQIRQRGKKLGFCQWSVIQKTSIDEDQKDQNEDDDDHDDDEDEKPEGMIEEIVGYQIRLEGNLSNDQNHGVYLRFGSSFHLQSDAENWDEMKIKIGRKDDWLEVSASQKNEEIKIKHIQKGRHSEFRFAFEDLHNPTSLERAFGLSNTEIFPSIQAFLQFERSSQMSQLFQFGLDNFQVSWEAGTRFMNLAHTRVRVYFLRTTLFEDHSIELMISRAGEIVKARFPNNIELVNDAFADL